ncbi:hypothetical protein SAMN02799630_00465 [Paenibacillus sp. UNCCL117]|uniref:hypothetical protein n=1 Tax=unclassified Paenibacillus TaxID=185978 RepID=UPI0008883752|nr:MULTISPECIES: hypothetical protein [unclassified Paenibacillus]SDC39349.1 hypothetical protein SAMN04488602_10267 [Paenibacillus sp. cl123]SFW14132.1 hypothetical protein SAMN02799630_00465 [Paenibacillus sp. UNCCL117]
MNAKRMQEEPTYARRTDMEEIPLPEEHYLPPRKSVHPTEKEKWLRIFYRSLLWIFILLVTGLLLWGWKRLNP